MSKQINVNPGQYKVAGRDRPGEPLGQPKDKVRAAKASGSIVKKTKSKKAR